MCEDEDRPIVGFCLLCGWATADLNDTVCDCPDGIPRS